MRSKRLVNRRSLILNWISTRSHSHPKTWLSHNQGESIHIARLKCRKESARSNKNNSAVRTGKSISTSSIHPYAELKIWAKRGLTQITILSHLSNSLRIRRGRNRRERPGSRKRRKRLGTHKDKGRNLKVNKMINRWSKWLRWCKVRNTSRLKLWLNIWNLTKSWRNFCPRSSRCNTFRSTVAHHRVTIRSPKRTASLSGWKYSNCPDILSRLVIRWCRCTVTRLKPRMVSRVFSTSKRWFEKDF